MKEGTANWRFWQPGCSLREGLSFDPPLVSGLADWQSTGGPPFMVGTPMPLTSTKIRRIVVNAIDNSRAAEGHALKAPKVFISYSHDSEEHGDRVLAFANRLREDGIEAILDQYEHPPPNDWPLWMDKHIRDADFVLMVCTKTYYRRIMNEEEPGKGFGVRWEGKLIYQHIYQGESTNTRFIPILFDDCKVDDIPTPVKGGARYRINSEQGYEDLYRHLTNQPKTVKPELGKLKKLPQRKRSADFPAGPRVSLAKLPTTNPELFGREDELALLDKAWKDAKTNIVAFVAWGGVGKTALVDKWLKRMQKDHFHGAQRVYGWSFYSQGAREGAQVSADEFIAAALKWFGDPDPTEGSPWDKGERLAELVKQQRTLLILDGMEPLQTPPGKGVKGGEIKDPGLGCLLKELATDNLGLCVMTTRMDVDDLKGFESPSVEHVDLDKLSDEAGAQLLKTLGVVGTDDELKEATHDFDGHALALTLLGTYLKVVHDGEIRQRDLIPALMDEQKQGAHARRVMESYEKWFDGKPELDILRIMGLFDRPAEAGAIEKVKAKPAIKGLTSKLQKLSIADWKFALNRLREVKLLAPEDKDLPGRLDCHPLVREHFGEKLKEGNSTAWEEAHSRLYGYYKAVPKRDLPDSIEEIAPLFAAVAHGCHAGRYEEALIDVYYRRIQRGDEGFGKRRLGAMGAELVALSGFFDPPWSNFVALLSANHKSYVFNEVGHDLRSLGRLSEAIQPMEVGLAFDLAEEDWLNAASAANSLSLLYSTLGRLERSLEYALQGMKSADSSQDWERQMISRVALADALHQAGRFSEAVDEFCEAEQIQEENQQELPLLYALQGYQCCDLMLSEGNHLEVHDRASQTLKWVVQFGGSLLAVALNHLTLGRACLLQAEQETTGDFTQAVAHLNEALDGLRKAGDQNYIARGLLARAELYRFTENFDKAQKDLSEAMTITTRGGMRLYEADCHLEQARLHLATGNKDDARQSRDIAKKMVNEMGYHRRDQEVDDLDQKLP